MTVCEQKHVFKCRKSSKTIYTKVNWINMPTIYPLQDASITFISLVYFCSLVSPGRVLRTFDTVVTQREQLAACPCYQYMSTQSYIDIVDIIITWLTLNDHTCVCAVKP